MTLPEDLQLHLVDSLDEAQAFMAWLSTCPEVAVDTETTGLDRRVDRVRLIQFGDRHHGWAIPWDEWRGVALDALRRFTGHFIFFNAKFDVGMIEANCDFRFDLSRVDDVMVMAHIENPRGHHGLKGLSALRVDRRAAAMQSVLEEARVANKWTWATIPLDFQPYWAYGALDAVLTMHLKDTYDVPQLAYGLEMASVWIARRMEDRGARIDVPYTRTAITDLTLYCNTTHTWCLENYGVTPGSDVKIVERLQQDGVVFTKLTKAGNRYSLDREVLSAIAHPLAEVVLQRRKVSKLVGTYLENFIEFADEEGVLHPQIHPMMSEQGGARTGRMSITQPALQTLPRKSEENPLSILVRNCFIPRNGNKLILCDFDQIEARMFAHLAQDPAMIAAFNEGDFFTNIARMIYADDTIIKKDPRRQVTKNSVYAKAYGAGTEKFALTAGIPFETAAIFMETFDRLFPGVKRFQRDVGNVATQRGITEGRPYVRSPLTGRLHVADEGKEYALVNYLIQGTAAEVFKMKLLELDAQGVGEYMVLPVHDEIILDVPADLADDVAHTVSTTMSDDTLFTVPLTAGVDIVDRWGLKGA